MSILFRIIAIIISTYLGYKIVFEKIIKNNFNILHFVYALFYLVQTLPIVQELIFGIDEDIKRYGLIYQALTNKTVDVLYSILIIVISISLYFLAEKINKIKKRNNISFIQKKLKNSFLFKNEKLKRIFFIGMFITIPFIIFAPNIKVYTSFAYFYTNTISSTSKELIYHSTIVSRVNLISFLCTFLFYVINDKKEKNIFVILSVILFTWINQKRTLVLFFLIGILFVDFFIKNKDKKKLIIKSIIFFLLEVMYFFVYRYLTGKGMDHTFSWLYTFYFSRMAGVKTSIYDWCVDRNVLSYSGQSLLAEVFWFIPRIIWHGKPYPYNIYFTAFVYGKPILEISWNFQVNILCEFISNFGIFGPFAGLYFMYYLSKKIEETTNILVYLFGALFIVLYCVFGATGIVLYSLSLFVFFYILDKLMVRLSKVDMKHLTLNDILNCFNINDKVYLQINYFKRFHRFINFKNPKSFNEKIQWLKIYDRNSKYTQLVDKYEVKKIVSSLIGEEYIIPTLGVYQKFEDINFKKLPNQFVIKCSHDSGGVVICNDKSKFDYDKAKSKIEKALSNNYYYHGREWPYKNVIPRIIVEEYMKDINSHELIDYKFICFNGKVKSIFTCTERYNGGLKVTFFDLNWKKQPFERHYPASKKNINKPKNFNKMIELSEKLAKDIPFVRIDWYEINGKLYFGEYTFYPGNGLEEFTPEELDYKLGDLLDLSVIKNNSSK